MKQPIFFGKVMRAARKFRGLSQVEVAGLVGVSQSFTSKVEKGLLIPSATHWFTICNVLQIEFASALIGHIDYMNTMKVNDANRAGDFTIPPRYNHLKGSSVRTTLNFIEYLKRVDQDLDVNLLIKKLGLDPDYFTILSNPINLYFHYDLIHFAVERYGLKPSQMKDIAALESETLVHGGFLTEYNLCKTSSALAHAFARNIRRYAINWNYEFDFKDHKGQLDIIETPSEFLSEFDLRKGGVDIFLATYRKNFMDHFFSNSHARSLEHGKPEVSSTITIEKNKCIYQYDLNP